MTPKQASPPRYSRLANTTTFRDNALARWLDAIIFVFGAGNLGQRVARECLLAGATVIVCDFARTKDENLGTQFGTIGTRKVDTIVRWAENSVLGTAIGSCCDVRHVGIGQLAKAQLGIDCTDDAGLVLPLTTISNGLGFPLLRPALDGSGAAELGRVACSHGGCGYACQLCTYEVRDLFRHAPRTPCQPNGRATRPSTLAGGAIGSTIAGIAVLQAQRLVTGNDIEQALDHEWVVDLSNGQLLPIRRERSAHCLSGHVRWELTPVPHLATATTWRELFAIAERISGAGTPTIQPYMHALCVEVACACGRRCEAVGSRWAKPPDCARCGQPMQWVRETCRPRLTTRDLTELGLADELLSETGMPEQGAMFVARVPGKPPIRIVLS